MFAVPENGLAESVVMNFDMIFAESLSTTIKTHVSTFKIKMFHWNLTLSIGLLFAILHLTLLTIRHRLKRKASWLKNSNINVIFSIYQMNSISFRLLLLWIQLWFLINLLHVGFILIDIQVWCHHHSSIIISWLTLIIILHLSVISNYYIVNKIFIS